MDYKKLAEIAEKRGVSPKYQETIRLYLERLLASGQSLYSIRNKIFACCQLTEWLNEREYNEFKEETCFNGYISHLKQRGLKDNTIDHMKLLIKDFIGWHLKSNPPAYLGCIKLKNSKKELIEAELLKPSEIKDMMLRAGKQRDKAIIITLYETAARISELLNIRLKDIEFGEQETIIRIMVSKTKKRKVPVFDATPYLLDLVNNHPYKDDPNAYAFMSYASNRYGKMLWPDSVGRILKLTAKRAGIKKPVYCHLLRHSRLSWLAKVEKLNERDLRILAGWSERSDMPNTYLHYNIEGVLEKMRINRGILDTKGLEQEHEKQVLQPKKCPRCQRTNPSDSSFCNCGMPLTTTAHLKLEEIKKQEQELPKS
ncbi:MAG: tyrosine-type recombinase/integrase [archaeon]